MDQYVYCPTNPYMYQYAGYTMRIRKYLQAARGTLDDRANTPRLTYPEETYCISPNGLENRWGCFNIIPWVPRKCVSALYRFHEALDCCCPPGTRARTP